MILVMIVTGPLGNVLLDRLPLQVLAKLDLTLVSLTLREPIHKARAPIAYVYFPDSLAIPQVAPENMKEVISPANTFFHQLLPISSFMGVATLPLWTILTGYQLLKKRRPAYA